MLTGGAYESRTIIAAAQRCLNLYPEYTPREQGEPSIAAHLCTPGLTLLSVAPSAPIRCLYTASNGVLFGVADHGVYYIDSDWIWHPIGALVGSEPSDAAPRYNPVSMTDSNLYVLICDGSVDGWTIALTANNKPLPPSSYVLTRIDSTNNTVTGTVANPTVAPGSTFIWQMAGTEHTATAAATDITASDMATEINNIAQGATPPLTFTAYTNSTGNIVLKDTSGGQIQIGPGTANKALGLTDGQFGAYDPGGWTGADRVDFTDTYFVFNKLAAVDKSFPINTPLFGISGSEAITFDSLDFAGKSDKGDNLVSIAVVHRVIWLLGRYTTEIWFDSGGGGLGTTSTGLSVNTFPFEELGGTFISTGCAAKYSVAVADNNLFFLGQNSAGHNMVMMATGYNCSRISTHAIEVAISQYSTTADAVGFCYQQQGHLFYQLSFPTGDQTWVFDTDTKLWHERCWLDSNGKEHRHRANTCAFAYNTIVVGDWENSNLYAYDIANYTDNGAPIKRLRSFPHQIDPEANRRIIFKQLIANMAVGTASDATATQVAINTTFNATDGTLLQNYVGSGDIGSTFTQIDTTSNGEVIGDRFVGLGGTTSYMASGTPLSPNYTTQFVATPSNYALVANTSMYVIGRAAWEASYNGYKMTIAGNTTHYTISLTVMGVNTTTSVNAGTLISGNYLCILTMNQTAITVSVQRSQDGLWLTATGTWSGLRVNCIAIIDATYTQAGRVIIGGDWS